MAKPKKTSWIAESVRTQIAALTAAKNKQAGGSTVAAKKPKVTVSKKLQNIQAADPGPKTGRKPRTRPAPPEKETKKPSKKAAAAARVTADQRRLANIFAGGGTEKAYNIGLRKFQRANPNASVAQQEKYAASYEKQAAAIGKSMLKSLDSGTGFSSRVANFIDDARSTDS